MNKKMEDTRYLLAPSLLSADMAKLGQEVAAMEEAGADLLHVDVMDGHFVSQITMGPLVVQALPALSLLPLDVHLMVTNPMDHLRPFAELGAAMLTVHAETCHHLQATLATIRSLGCAAGVALNPHTPESILRYVLQDLDLVLIMTVNPGFGGQQMLRPVLPKIQAVRTMLDGAGKRHVRVAVDGGVTPANVGDLAKAGADLFVAGSALFGQPNYRVAVDAFRDSLSQSA